MKRKPEGQKLIEQQRRGDLRSFILDNPVAAAELKYQCEEGSVPDPVLLALLDAGYGKRRKGKETSRGKSLAFVGRDGRPWDQRMRDMTSTAPEITPIQALTLGNPVVRSRLRYEFEDGTMRPRIYKWFIEHGPELLKQTERRPPLYFVGDNGLPWENDPLAEREKAFIARREAQAKKELTGQPPEETPEEVTGEEEAEETLEVYRPRGE